jgi:hypothetical protein
VGWLYCKKKNKEVRRYQNFLFVYCGKWYVIGIVEVIGPKWEQCFSVDIVVSSWTKMLFHRKRLIVAKACRSNVQHLIQVICNSVYRDIKCVFRINIVYGKEDNSCN